MNILIFNNCKIPVYAYGGTERVIWDLGRGLTEAGHRVSFLVKKARIVILHQYISMTRKSQLRCKSPMAPT